jgi:hypothetical protein
MLEKNHNEIKNLRIIFDGNELFINGRIYNFFYTTIKNEYMHIVKNDEFLNLSIRFNIIPNNVLIQNYLIYNRSSVSGKLVEHNCIELSKNGESFTLVQTHNNSQYSITEEETYFLHIVKNINVEIRENNNNRLITSKLYYLLATSNSYEQNSYINSIHEKSLIKKVAFNFLKNIYDKEMVSEIEYLSKKFGVSDDKMKFLLANVPSKIVVDLIEKKNIGDTNI